MMDYANMERVEWLKSELVLAIEERVLFYMERFKRFYFCID